MGRVEVVNRNFILVTEDRTDRTFTHYHLAHRHAAGLQDTDAPRFQLPAVGNRYPRSSLPALEAATWARQRYPTRFSAFDLALFEAFFVRTEDISNPEVLARIAASVGLDPAALRAALESGTCRQTVLREHLEAADQGIHGIPTILIPRQRPIVGAVPYADLKQAVERALSGSAPKTPSESGAEGIILQEGTAFW